MFVYELLNSRGEVVSTMVADADYMADNYPTPLYRMVGPYMPPVSVSDASAPDPTWVISDLAFKKRFPRAKWTAFMMAARSGQSELLFDIADSMDRAKYIDLKDDELVYGIYALGATDVPDAFRLTGAEIDAVLSVPASEDELP